MPHGGLEKIYEKFRCRNDSLTVSAPNYKVSICCHDSCRKISCRVSVRRASTDSADIADLLIADLACRIVKESELFLYDRVVLDNIMDRQGADSEIILVLSDVRHILEFGNVHQRSGSCKPQFHQSQKALASGKYFGIFLVVKQLNSFGDCSRRIIIEFFWCH